MPLARGTLVTHCYKDLGFMDFICSLVTKSVKVSHECVVECVGSQNDGWLSERKNLVELGRSSYVEWSALGVHEAGGESVFSPKDFFFYRSKLAYCLSNSSYSDY